MNTLITATDYQVLTESVQLLEYPNLTAHLANALGKPAEWVIFNLPLDLQSQINTLTQTALNSALSVAVTTMDANAEDTNPNNWLHRLAVSVTGAAGGMFGFAGLAVELPATTVMMLRSIMAIAQDEGENINNPETHLQCLTIFALGSPKTDEDDSVDSGYFATRLALAHAVSQASEYLATKGLADASAPVIVKFINQVAARYSLVISEKVAAQAVPLIGAVAGAAINTVFINHFQNIARGHFAIRRLEKRYGSELINQEYLKIKQGTNNQRLINPPQ